MQAGHHMSFHSGAPEHLALEDAWFNQLSSNKGETQGAIFEKPAIDIGGIPVETRTAEMWEHLGLLPPGTVEHAPHSPGWDPLEPDGGLPGMSLAPGHHPVGAQAPQTGNLPQQMPWQEALWMAGGGDLVHWIEHTDPSIGPVLVGGLIALGSASVDVDLPQPLDGIAHGIEQGVSDAFHGVEQGAEALVHGVEELGKAMAEGWHVIDHAFSGGGDVGAPHAGPLHAPAHDVHSAAPPDATHYDSNGDGIPDQSVDPDAHDSNHDGLPDSSQPAPTWEPTQQAPDQSWDPSQPAHEQPLDQPGHAPDDAQLSWDPSQVADVHPDFSWDPSLLGDGHGTGPAIDAGAVPDALVAPVDAVDASGAAYGDAAGASPGASF